MATEVKLVGCLGSPFAWRVAWALKLKGVEYEYIDEDIFNKSTRLLELNPVHKKVPVFVHDNKVIAESLVILEYIDETWEHNPLLPKDPYERAMERFWAKSADEKLWEAAWKAMWSKGEAKEKAVKETVEFLERIEGVLKETRYCEGESIGYLEMTIGWISYWLPVFEEIGSMQILNPVQFPGITAWTDKFLSHPSVQDNLPPRDKLLTLFTERSRAIYNYAVNHQRSDLTFHEMFEIKRLE